MLDLALVHSSAIASVVKQFLSVAFFDLNVEILPIDVDNDIALLRFVRKPCSINELYELNLSFMAFTSNCLSSHLAVTPMY